MSAVLAPRHDNFLSVDRLVNLAADQYADDLLILQGRLTSALETSDPWGDWADYEHEIGEAVRKAMAETADETLSIRRSCIGAAALEAVKARAAVMAAQYIAANQPSAIDLDSILNDERCFKRWAGL